MSTRDWLNGFDLHRLLQHKLLRHGAGFLVSGTMAFCVDAAVLQVLTGPMGIDPIIARLMSMSVAMVVGWLAHRRLTFAVSAPPTVAEFVRYAGVAWFSAAVNYGVFVAAVLMWDAIPPFLALVFASVIAMFVSYVGMRFAAFRLPTA